MRGRTRVAIGLGSNQGDRAEFLRQATERLQSEFLDESATSSVYESPAWGYTDQGPFLNSVVVGYSEWRPAALINFLKTLERELGRVKSFHWGPREIDLDLLVFGTEVIEDASGPYPFRVPHAGICERDFVLLPLCEVWPEWVHPVQGKSAQELLHSLRSSGPLSAKVFAAAQ